MKERSDNCIILLTLALLKLLTLIDLFYKLSISHFINEFINF